MSCPHIVKLLIIVPVLKTTDTIQKMYNIDQLQELYEEFYGRNRFDYDPNGLYEPVRHIMSIKGKRFRPMLLLMACDMFGGDVKNALNAAFAIEIFHNFT